MVVPFNGTYNLNISRRFKIYWFTTDTMAHTFNSIYNVYKKSFSTSYIVTNSESLINSQKKVIANPNPNPDPFVLPLFVLYFVTSDR